MQLMSGFFVHVCGYKVDNSSNYCDNMTYDNRRFSFVKCDTIFRLFFCVNYHKFNFAR